ncbi:synaptopodin-2, putative [Ixodes scapularis]|uniref:Synaptopodin-2, putative n=1 Tax=Ixodes scapularis TaxID=6945 RepID=B7Q120_IXOSC|nr:synaptopodin-2, putative [Ixodes scapularis]|eukprot:XP_002408827.1 synaptopodin-2, putative [Ixodes scapularis]
MASEARSIAVTLTGGGPWGFRLRGGRGTGTPLTVLKTRRKSKAHQVLLEGDVLVSVNGTPCESLSHDQVMAIVDSGCAELRLQLLR